jgi:integrase/recombinase XerD
VAGGGAVTALRGRAVEYLALRRALGFKLHCQGQLLLQFVDYTESQGTDRLSTDLAVAWARQPVGTNPAWWNRRLSVVRGFAHYLHTIDADCEVPPADIFPTHYRRALPYLFSEEEIVALMAAAAQLAPALRAATYETLVGLLAVTGLRVGEAIRLTRADIDWADGVLLVHNTKFGKSRQVPLQPSTIDALRGYSTRRDRLWSAPAPDNFFLSATGRGLNGRMVDWNFQRLVTDAGIDYTGHHRSPRPHDLRHRFIVATMRAWYEQGAPVEAFLPRLSTYVGHTKPADTYWYLQAAPELLALAVERLERAAAARP